MSEAIESSFSDILRRYSQLRSSKVLEPVTVMTGRIFENNMFFHYIIVLSALLVIIAVFAHIRNLTLFSLHPVCMSVGVLIFLAEGIVTYRNKKLAECLSPIMQHSARMKVRSLHSSLQVIGSSFLSLGMLFIFSHKAKWKKSMIPGSLHSYAGTFCALLVVVQIFSGYEKVENLEKSNIKSRRWHGDLGLLLWDCLIFCCLTGMLQTVDLFSIFNFSAELSICVVWVMVHAQVKRRAEEYSNVDEDKGSQALKVSSPASNSNIEEGNPVVISGTREE
jgi:Eukaryotic cytochrome b561